MSEDREPNGFIDAMLAPKDDSTAQRRQDERDQEDAAILRGILQAHHEGYVEGLTEDDRRHLARIAWRLSRVEPTEPGACDREGCPVLHDDPANPIHPEDLTSDFHERTGRCVGGYKREQEIHAKCAGIELQHRQGEHEDCLPVEDGVTEKDYVGMIHEAREKLDVTVARCKVSITMGDDDVQRCERPEDGRHLKHTVADYHGSPLVWLEDSPRTTLVGRQEVNWFPEADSAGFVPRRTPAEEAFYAPQPPLTLEDRVVILENAVQRLHQRPSPYDVIG